MQKERYTMTARIQALICASAILLVAVASRIGIISDNLATFLILALPAFAWPSISRSRRGITCQKAEG